MLKTDFSVVQVKDLSFSYNQNPVLLDISFTIQNGDYVGLIGPNGGGKTTLIKLILGLVKADKGSIKIGGTDIDAHKSMSDIGYVPQKLTEGSVEFPASVLEIIQSGINYNKYPWQKLTHFELKSIQNVLKVSEILHLQNRLFQELSGGERQRVILARALVNKPKVLILDEPTVGVDSITQDKFYDFLKHLNHDHKMTIIFVSHDLAVVARQTSRILCLNQTLFEHDNPKDLLKEDFISRLYGQNFKFITHNHSHV